MTSQAVVGVIVDASTQLPVVGALVVATTGDGTIAGTAITDDGGIFVVYPIAASGLELAIPDGGVSGIAIGAGELLTVFVP